MFIQEFDYYLLFTPFPLLPSFILWFINLSFPLNAHTPFTFIVCLLLTLYPSSLLHFINLLLSPLLFPSSYACPLILLVDYVLIIKIWLLRYIRDLVYLLFWKLSLSIMGLITSYIIAGFIIILQGQEAPCCPSRKRKKSKWLYFKIWHAEKSCTILTTDYSQWSFRHLIYNNNEFCNIFRL